jgi:hypothetical protein
MIRRQNPIPMAHSASTFLPRQGPATRNNFQPSPPPHCAMGFTIPRASHCLADFASIIGRARSTRRMHRESHIEMDCGQTGRSSSSEQRRRPPRPINTQNEHTCDKQDTGGADWFCQEHGEIPV